MYSVVLGLDNHPTIQLAYRAWENNVEDEG